MNANAKLNILATVGAGYIKESEGAVASSVEIDESVIADYDEFGNVVGFEFLDGDAVTFQKEVGKYRSLARKMSPGRRKISPPPEI